MESYYNYNLYFLRIITLFFLNFIIDFKTNYYLTLFLIFLCFIFFNIWNFIYFFIIFELRRIPVIFITLIFGFQIEKLSSSFYLFFYRILTSFPFLISVIFFKLNLNNNLTYFENISNNLIIFFLFLIFIIKFPIYFLHNWLPKIHVESSIIGRILLAGLLLKFGTLGFTRLLILINYTSIIILILIRVLGILIGIFLRIIQRDIKSQAAYSSVVHINLLIVLLLINRNISLSLSLIIIVRHGFSRVLLFWIVSNIYYYSNTRINYFLNSLIIRNNFINMIYFLISLSNISIPLTIGYYSELRIFFIIIPFIFFLFILSGFIFIYDLYIIIFIFLNIIFGKNLKNILINSLIIIIFFLELNINSNFFFIL